MVFGDCLSLLSHYGTGSKIIDFLRLVISCSITVLNDVCLEWSCIVGIFLA